MIKIYTAFIFLLLITNSTELLRVASSLDRQLQELCKIQGETGKFCPTRRYEYEFKNANRKLPESHGKFVDPDKKIKRREAPQLGVDETRYSEVFENFEGIYCCNNWLCMYRCNPLLRSYENAIVKGFPANSVLLEELDKRALFTNSPMLKFRTLRNIGFFSDNIIASEIHIPSTGENNCTFHKKVLIYPEDFEPFRVFLASQGRYFDELLSRKYPQITLPTRNFIFSNFTDVMNFDFPNNISKLRTIDKYLFDSNGMTEEMYLKLKNGTASCYMVQHWKILVGGFRPYFESRIAGQKEKTLN